MGSPMAPSDFTLNGPEMSKSRSLTFKILIFHEGAGLGHMLILNVNRKPYISSLVRLYVAIKH